MNGFNVAACAALFSLAVVAASGAQSTEPALRDTAFLTCADVNGMAPEERTALGLRIANAAATYYQAQIADSDEVGQELGWLIRSGCTIAPEAYFSAVVARSVRVMGGGIEPPLQQPLDMGQAVFLSCTGTKSLAPEQLKQVGTYIGTEAAAHYGLTPGPGWSADYVAALVHNGCKMYPEASYLGMIGRAVRAVAAATPPASGQPASGQAAPPSSPPGRVR